MEAPILLENGERLRNDGGVPGYLVLAEGVRKQTKADIDRFVRSFDWDSWQRRLEERYGDWYRETVDAAGRATGGSEWRSDDPFIEEFGRQYIGQRITQILETTRESVKERLNDAIAEGHESGDPPSLQDLAGILEDFDDFSPSRALTIARTESAYAVNHGEGASFSQRGYNYVEISDGESYDDECAEVDGQIWSIEYFMANALGHPNCERSIAGPVSDEEADDQGVDQE